MSLVNLKRIKLFAGLTEEDLQRINENIEWKEYPRNLSIISHKDESTDVYFIVSGSVKVTTFSFSGREISYQQLERGDMFGELSGIDGLSRSTNVMVLEKSEIGKISENTFWCLIEEYPKVIKPLLLRLTELIRFLCGRVYEYGSLNVADRIRAEILRTALKHMVNDECAEISRMPTHEEIANRVCTHREAVTKEFSKLYKDGVIVKRNPGLMVPRIDSLKQLIVEEVTT